MPSQSTWRFWVAWPFMLGYFFVIGRWNLLRHREEGS